MNETTAYLLVKVSAIGERVILAGHYSRAIAENSRRLFPEFPAASLRVVTEPITRWPEIAELTPRSILRPILYRFRTRKALDRAGQPRTRPVFRTVRVTGAHLVYPVPINERWNIHNGSQFAADGIELDPNTGHSVEYYSKVVVNNLMRLAARYWRRRRRRIQREHERKHG